MPDRARYGCRECPFSTEDEAEMHDHVVTEHVDPREHYTDRHNEEPEPEGRHDAA